jgi:hypothetical protein
MERQGRFADVIFAAMAATSEATERSTAESCSTGLLMTRVLSRSSGMSPRSSEPQAPDGAYLSASGMPSTSATSSLLIDETQVDPDLLVITRTTSE